MKIFRSFLTLAFLAVMSFTFYSCEELAEESCEQQDMNEVMNCGVEKNVEVCCTEGAECVYHYDGQDYPDTADGLNDLADALNCTYKNSVDYQEQKEFIIEHLVSLMERARNKSNL